jgi:hypothetical protein
MSKTKLRVRDAETGIPTVSPSLMPFRIEYSGPAPISTYFLTRPFIDADEKRRRLAVATTLAGELDNNAENCIDNVTNPSTGESECVQGAPEEKKDALSGRPVVETTKDQPEAGTSTRLSAAFRGRKVVSHDVVLPDGYTGLLLTSSTAKAAITEDTSKEDGNAGRIGKRGNAKAKSAVVKAGDRAKALKAKAAAKKGGAKGGARRSRKVVEDDVEEDEGLADGDELEPQDELVQLEGDTTQNGEGVPGDPLVEDKVFEVTGQFQRFAIWHPDVPVDEARDEYTRSLKEWIALASEVRRIAQQFLIRF